MTRFAVLIAVCVASTAAFGQCEENWQQIGPGVGRLVDDPLDAVVYDFGDGPRLVIGGDFTLRAGAMTATNLVVWDGRCWSSLNGRLNGPVRALAVFEGSLIAAGEFTHVDDRLTGSVVAWDGDSWEPLTPAGVSGPVQALVEFQGSLHALGHVTFAGGHPMLGHARWDGEAWLPSDVPVEGDIEQAAATSTSMFIAGNSLNLRGQGGNIGKFIRWDGGAAVTTISLTGGLVPLVNALAVWNDELFVGGEFQRINNLVVNNVARWDGAQWRSLAGGTDNTVHGIEAWGDRVVVTGSFDQAGGVTVDGLGLWDGSTWSDLDAPFGGQPLAFEDALMLGFNAWFDGDAWTTLAPPLTYTTMNGNFVEYRGELFASGDWGPSLTGVAKIKADSAILVSGREISSPLASFGDDLVAVERRSDGVTRAVVRAWDGTSWRDLGEGFTHTSGVPSIETLVVIDGVLYAGGRFTHVGATAASNLARWDGAAWVDVDGGLSGGGSGLRVLTIAPWANGIAVGGRFTIAGGVPSTNIALWDTNGWSAAASLSSTEVASLALHQGTLVAAGTIQCGVPNVCVMSWDGEAWTEIGRFDRAFSPAPRLLSAGDSLFIAGGFVAVDDVLANPVARWDGQQWHPVGQPALAVDEIRSLFTVPIGLFRGELVAGNFTTPGTTDGVINLARFGCPSCVADRTGSSDPDDPAYGWPDGVLDAADFFYVLDRFVEGNVAVDFSGSSDPFDSCYGTGDGVVDTSDVFWYLDRFVEGCP